MLERDYLMKLLLGYFQTIIVCIRRSHKEKDPEGAADLLEEAIGQATEIDGAVLLSLAPESMAGVLQVSGTDPKVIGFVAHGLLLEAHYLMLAMDFAKAELREQQARALADAYGIDLPDDLAEAEDLLRTVAEEGLANEGAVDAFHAAAHYEDEDTSVRFDPDAPLLQPELHESGSFGWQGDARR